MVSLIDTNIIIRFLVADNEEQFKIAKDIFFEIEKSQKIVIILTFSKKSKNQILHSTNPFIKGF